MLVYVQHTDGSPLMPCRPAIARVLLKNGHARVNYRTPLTLRLTRPVPHPYRQPLKVGLDPGSGTFGVAVLTHPQNEVLYLSAVQVRNDITQRLTRRRTYRRTRRGRKCRYRPPRFSNRRTSKRVGRLPPTVGSKLQAHQRELRCIQRTLPLALMQLTIERAQFDVHALKDPRVVSQSWRYHQGEQYGYENIKMYVRARDKHICQLCKGKSQDPRLECHHLIPRAEGGTDAPTNLVTLCETCPTDIHAGTRSLATRTVRASLKRQVSATPMNVLSSQLQRAYPQAQPTLGCITNIDRQRLGYPKTHYWDAAVIASGGRPFTLKQPMVLQKRCHARGEYQQRQGKRSERPVPRRKIQGFKTYDQVRYRGQTYVIKGRMSAGYAILMAITGHSVPLKPIPKLIRLTRLQARTSLMFSPLSHPPSAYLRGDRRHADSSPT